VLSMTVSPRVNLRFGMKAVLIPSLLLIVAGLAILGRAPADGHYFTDVFPALLLLGIGGGLAFPALVGLGMSDAKPADSGLASGINNTTQQVGGALGLAVLATLAASRTSSAQAAGAQQADALTAGYHVAFLTASGIVALGVVLALFVLRSPASIAKVTPVLEECQV
jgi:MFS family permease